MAFNIIDFQDGFSWSDVKSFTVLALKEGSTMALQSVNFKKLYKVNQLYNVLRIWIWPCRNVLPTPSKYISMSLVAIMRGNLSKK